MPVIFVSHALSTFYKMNSRIPNMSSHSQHNQLTIIIPTKNEEAFLPLLLQSILQQINCDITSIPILICDSQSTDGTLEVIKQYIELGLNIRIIAGGLPAIARNNGAKHAQTPFLLFLDADITLISSTLIHDALYRIEHKKLDLVTCYTSCNQDMRGQILYQFHNIGMHIARLDAPFSTTMFMLIRRSVFEDIGGFDERAQHCEDMLLSRQIPRSAFGILHSFINTSSRRFKKEGYFGFLRMFILNAWNRNNTAYFYNDIGYWK